MTDRPTAVQRAHRAIEEMAELRGGDPSQEEIIAHVRAAMNPPTYPEPKGSGIRVTTGFWASDIYQLVVRSGRLEWIHVASDEAVEWWQICEKGTPQLLTASPIEASS